MALRNVDGDAPADAQPSFETALIQLNAIREYLDEIEATLRALNDTQRRARRAGKRYRAASIATQTSAASWVVDRLEAVAQAATIEVHFCARVPVASELPVEPPCEDVSASIFRRDGERAQLTEPAAVAVTSAVFAVARLCAESIVDHQVEVPADTWTPPTLLARDPTHIAVLARLKEDHGEPLGGALAALVALSEWFHGSRRAPATRRRRSVAAFNAGIGGTYADDLADVLLSRLDKELARVLADRLGPASPPSKITEAAAGVVGRMFPAVGVRQARILVDAWRDRQLHAP